MQAPARPGRLGCCWAGAQHSRHPCINAWASPERPRGRLLIPFRSLEVSGEDQGPSRCRRHVAARAAWHGAGAGRRLAGLGAGGWPAHRCSLRWSGKRSLQRGASPGGPQGGLPAGCGASRGAQQGRYSPISSTCAPSLSADGRGGLPRPHAGPPGQHAGQAAAQRPARGEWCSRVLARCRDGWRPAGGGRRREASAGRPARCAAASSRTGSSRGSLSWNTIRHRWLSKNKGRRLAAPGSRRMSPSGCPPRAAASPCSFLPPPAWPGFAVLQVCVRCEEINISGGMVRQKAKYERFLRKRSVSNPRHGAVKFRCAHPPAACLTHPHCAASCMQPKLAACPSVCCCCLCCLP